MIASMATSQNWKQKPRCKHSSNTNTNDLGAHYWQWQLKPNKRSMTHFLIREPDSKNIWVFAMQKSKTSYVITPFAVLRIDCIYDDVIQWFTIISQKGSLQGSKFDFHWIAFLKLERYVFDTRNSTVHIHKSKSKLKKTRSCLQALEFRS